MYTILVNNHNISKFKICNCSKLSPSKRAANELCKYLDIQDTAAEGSICVGLIEDIPALAHYVNQTENESICIKISGTDIFIAGGSGRSVIYAVYEFLEMYCGWRFFAPGVETQPQGKVNIEDTEYFYNPPFDYRMSLTPSAGQGTDHFQKRHLNAVWGPTPLPDDVGGSVYYAASNAHTFKDLLPDKEYMFEHPEYFATDENGKRYSEPNPDNQPCLSHPDVFPIMLENARKILRNNPRAHFISISQNDGELFCHCEACKKINEEEQTDGGTVYRFVNRMAIALKEEFPNVLIDTLPYMFSTKPPVKSILNDNVSIRLCLMNTCREHTITDESCPYNKKVRDYLAGWSEKCNNIYIWDYTANFKNYPVCLPNFKILYQNIHRLMCFPIKGILYQGAHTCDPSIEFGELWGYLQGKLLWNPHMSYVEYLNCIKEFLRAYYGGGAEFLYEYIVLAMMQPSSDYHYGPSATCEQVIPMLKMPDGSPDMTFIKDANDLFDLAETASDGEQLKRVRRTRLHLTWYEICTTYSYIRENGTTDQIEALRIKYETFFNTVKQWEKFSICEGGHGRLYNKTFNFDIHPNEYLLP